MTSLHQTTRVLQFGGAVGTLGALGAAGPRVAASLASELGLRLPEVSWHTSRDRIAEVATVIALLIGTLGKMARDISLMAQSEVDEVREASASKRGRSSTMPQKRNPVGCARVLAASVRVPQLAATMLAAMSQEHERGLGGWQAEWETVPAICTVGYDALTQMADVIAGLEVDERRMAENLAVTRGLAFAEAVSFALMPRMGRAAVEQVLGRAMVEVRNAKGGVHLRDALARDPKVAAHLSAEELDRLFDARAQLETATVMARAVVARARETLS